MMARRWRGVVLHHSAGPASQAVEAIRQFHVNSRGWQDIGYHWLIAAKDILNREEGGWEVVAGRSEELDGAHSPGLNKTHLGVCLIGDFTRHPPPLGQLAVAARAVAELAHENGFTVEDISLHRHHRPTECPGRQFLSEHLFALKREVERLLEEMEF